jgi:hypothetical protein
MARPTQEQMTWISSTMAARALTRAADPETRNQLVSALHSWLPEVDILTRRELAEGVAEAFRSIANAIDARRDRLVERGLATPYESES